MRTFRRNLRQNLPALLVFVGGIALWEGLIRGLAVRSFILPAPSSIVGALARNWETGYKIWPAAQTTFIEAGGGMVIGTLLGIVVALVISRWQSVRQVALPIAVAVNAIPIIAFAPIANNWFGVLSVQSKMVIASALVFFPIMINVLRGLTEVPASSLELMRSYAASPTAVFLKGLYAGLNDVGVPAVGVQSADDPASAMKAFQKAGLSTVDDVDTRAGKLALATLLSDPMARGDFGVKKTATDGPLPTVVPVVTTTTGG